MTITSPSSTSSAASASIVRPPPEASQPHASPLTPPPPTPSTMVRAPTGVVSPSAPRVDAMAETVRHAARLPLLTSVAVGTTAGLLAVLPYYGVRGAEDWWHGEPIASAINQRHLALVITVPVAAWLVGVGVGLALRYGNKDRRRALGELRAMRDAAGEPGHGPSRASAAGAARALRRSAWMPWDDVGLVTLGTVGSVLLATVGTAVAILATLCLLSMAGLSGHAPTHADCGGCSCDGGCDACSLCLVPNCPVTGPCWPVSGRRRGDPVAPHARGDDTCRDAASA